MAVVFLNPKKLSRKLSKLKDVPIESKVPEEIPVELFDNIRKFDFVFNIICKVFGYFCKNRIGFIDFYGCNAFVFSDKSY